VFRELEADVGVRVPEGFGDLTAWAERGMLLLNTVLTVRAHAPASHKGKGWEAFTDAVLAAVARGPRPVVFCLWGAHARAKKKSIDTTRHAVIECAHPSPLSVTKFRGSRPFSRIDEALVRFGGPPFDWTLG
jgi:uracil-DNA glycosylase